MKNLRIAVWLLIALGAAFLAYSYVRTDKAAHWTETVGASLGGPFELISHTGEPLTQDALKDRPHAIFFGFTHCPEICPTTMFEASSWLKQLGDDGDRVDFYFVTVDPERDTVEALARYMDSFDPRITGLTGSPEKIAEMIAAYRVYARKVPLEDDDYTMDHSASVLVFKSDGGLLGTISWGENTDTAIAKLRRAINE